MDKYLEKIFSPFKAMIIVRAVFSASRLWRLQISLSMSSIHLTVSGET